MDTQQEPQFLSKKERRELRRQEKMELKEDIKQKKTAVRAITWISVIAVLGLALWGMIKLSQSTNVPGNNIAIPPVVSTDIFRGNKDAKVVLVEYADFQCPACGYYEPIVEQLYQTFKDQVLFVYRYFPLASIHMNADLSARAAEAANIQGKFWEMYEMLYKNQSTWSNSTNAANIFTGYAQTLGLNIDQFKSDINSSAVKNKVANDYNQGASAGINATPSFFLNGQHLTSGIDTYDQFKQTITQALSSQ